LNCSGFNKIEASIIGYPGLEKTYKKFPDIYDGMIGRAQIFF